MADAFRRGVGLDSGLGESPIVSVAVREGAQQAIVEHRIAAAMRAGKLRLSFHLPTTRADVKRAVEVLGPFVTLDERAG